MNVGTEWLVDAEDCEARLLRDVDVVRCICEEVIAELGLRVVGEPMWHQFPQPGGVTGLYLLTESHLTCHTFPETGLATFNLYCCRPRPPFAWDERLREALGATRVIVRTAARGAQAAADHDSLEASEHADARDHDSLEARGPASFEATFSEPPSTREVPSL
jgi:S-adenosylmethionine decarboxylase